MDFKIREIGHVGVRVADPKQSAAFYEKMMGFKITAEVDGRTYVTCDRHHHSMVFIPGEPGLDHLGLTVGSEAELDRAAAELERKGLAVTQIDGDVGHGRAVRFHDPDGRVVELYASMDEVEPPPYGHPVLPIKFGHVTMETKDIMKAHDFYRDVLGFRASDWIETLFVWMRCNPDHHGVAFVNKGRAGVDHYAFEVADFTDFKRVGDFFAANGWKIDYGPGRHGPGKNLFIYFPDHDGNRIEYFCELERIFDDEKHTAPVWKIGPDAMNIWGPQAPEGFQ